jgi:hypothetical protein
MAIDNDGIGWREAVAVGAIGLLATVVRLASEPPQTLARVAWLVGAGLGMATGGWLFAKAVGLDGWGAMACAWCAGALGAEGTLPVLRRWLDSKVPKQ